MSQDNQADSEGIDYSQMFLYSGPEDVALSEMTVYDHEFLRIPVLGGEITARIIGSSHYIDVPFLPYSEVTSCRPIDMVKDFRPVIEQYSIPDGISTEITRTVGHDVGRSYDATIHVMTMGGWIEVDPDGWDLVYTFEGDGPAAPTAIKAREDGWETIHTYPEYDTGVYTLTEFERRDG